MQTEKWGCFHGDCIPHMTEVMEPQSCDLVLTSVPFPAMFAYTSHAGDLGNTDTMEEESRIHFSFFYKALARVLKPGRVAIIHCMQIPRMKRSGGVGLCDFRGINIRIGERAGLVYEYDWMVRKNPQAQAIRTRSRELQFSGLEADRAKQRGTLCDYLIKFRAPGDNAVPIQDDDGEPVQVSRNQWIDWAEGAWFDIRETNTLNIRGTKGEDDTRHICPLQIDVIERCVRLFSNPGELVFSPFTGIGSEGVTALKLGRRFYGCELKDEYYSAACKNMAGVHAEESKSRSLFEDDEELIANAG